MSDAPIQIWAWPNEDGRGWYAGGCSNEPTMASADIPYILKEPAALAASPEVQELLREARAAWADRLDRIADEIDEQVKVTRAYVDDCGMDFNQRELMRNCTSHFIDKARSIRAAAATIRKGKKP